MALGSKVVSAIFAGLRKFNIGVFSTVASLCFMIALMLVIWRGGWEAQYQKHQLDFLGYGFLGSVGVWAVTQMRGKVSDLTFKAGAVEASVDFDDEETPDAGKAG